MHLTRTDAPRTSRRGRLRLPLAVIGLALLLAACSSTSGVSTLNGTSDGSTPTPQASVDPEEAITAFAECMREHGIDMPDPVIVRRGPGGGAVGGSTNRDPDGPAFDPNSEEFQAAEEACREHLEGFAAGPGDVPELTEEQQQALLDFSQCMREHGIDMPDPDFSRGGGGITIGPGEGGPGTEFDPGSEKFQAAEEACREHLGSLPQMERRLEQSAP